MPRFALLLIALALSPLAHAADGAEPTANPDGIAAVEAIGRINGTALACDQPAISSRARNAIMTSAPKTRSYGDAFETATNAAYLAQGQESGCPDAAALNSRLMLAERILQNLFQKP